MKKNIVSMMWMFLLSFNLFSQGVAIDKLIVTEGITRSIVEGLGTGPWTIIAEKREDGLIISDRASERALRFDVAGRNENKISYKATDVSSIYQIGKYDIGSSAGYFQIRENNKQVIFIRPNNFSSGISFILKKPPHYVAFFVNQDGQPHAADTTGKIYDSAQTMALLKTLDPEKYRQSRERAEELGLGDQFLANKVLVWGRTYYSTPALYEVTMPGKYAYNSNSDQLQYDLQGNGYQASFHSIESSIVAVNPDGEKFLKILINEHSRIMTNHKPGQLYTSSTYVGFGGNIYFCVAGEAFTEVFRIRRTWGEPDFYAMAVNGYTEDSYGAYVKKVLKDLSKEELRLLRNHLYALYGYVFKDSGLKSYFDKLVWYEPVPSATMDSIKLPAERQALLEMILAEEKKR